MSCGGGADTRRSHAEHKPIGDSQKRIKPRFGAVHKAESSRKRAFEVLPMAEHQHLARSRFAERVRSARHGLRDFCLREQAAFYHFGLAQGFYPCFGDAFGAVENAGESARYRANCVRVSAEVHGRLKRLPERRGFEQAPQ